MSKQLTAHFAKLSVLVIDDNAYHRAIICEILRAAGVGQIFTAANGDEAFEELRIRQPKAIILDWMMTPMDGLEFTRRVRRGQGVSNRAMPIIMVTAKNALANVEMARRAGVDEYAVKPVSAGQMLSRLAEVTLRPRRFIDSPVFVGPCRRRKKNDEYSGPRRRLVDPVDQGHTAENVETQMAIAKASVSRVADLAKHLRPGDRNQVRAIYNCSQETQAVAAAIGDGLLDQSACSLVRYVEGMGATDRLDPDVVRTHVDALVQLVALPMSEQTAREHVAEGLEKMVQKKLRQGAQAA